MGKPRIGNRARSVRRSHRIDYVAMVERAYRLNVSEAEWLDGLLEVMRPALDFGHGVAATVLSTSGDRRVSAERIRAVGIDDLASFAALQDEGGRSLSQQQFVRALKSHPCDSLVESLGGARRWVEAAAALFRRFGLPCVDQVIVRAQNPNGPWPTFVAPTEGPLLHPRRRAALARVAGHIAAAYRLREAAVSTDAVLDPRRGRLVHAEGDARERTSVTALVSAMKASETARGRLRSRSPEQAIELWRALVRGRWSLVESFDKDGRRYLLARRNAPDLGAAVESGGLPEERAVLSLAILGHSEKLIAYELGLSPSTVSTLARNGLRRFGARSTIELIRLHLAR